MGYSWRKDFNRPGTQAQMLFVGVSIAMCGLLGIFGAFGSEPATRVLAAAVAFLGLLLTGLALKRLRR